MKLTVTIEGDPVIWGDLAFRLKGECVDGGDGAELSALIAQMRDRALLLLTDDDGDDSCDMDCTAETCTCV